MIQECIANQEFYRLHKRIVESNERVCTKIVSVHNNISIELSQCSRMLTYMKTSGQVNRGGEDDEDEDKKLDVQY